MEKDLVGERKTGYASRREIRDQVEEKKKEKLQKRKKGKRGKKRKSYLRLLEKE